MKKLFLYTPIIASALLVMACNPQSTVLQKDIKHMDLHFKPLSRTDFTLVGNLSAETTVGGIYGAANPQTKVKPKYLTGTYAQNIKKGNTVRNEFTEFLYFSPGPNESMTGSLYDNEYFQNVYASSSVGLNSGAKSGGGGLIAKLKTLILGSTGKAVAAPADPARDYAFYGLIEKYPDIDYFINVRFDRKTVVKKNTWVETVTVKADGIKLKTD